MTSKSRYFLLTSAVVLAVGLGGGLMAYLAYQRTSGIPAGVPEEITYVPANAAVVVYANVRALMSSDLRRELMPAIEHGSRKGRQMMNDFAGIDLEKQVDHVVAYMEPSNAADAAADKATPSLETLHNVLTPQALMLVQGTFDQARIEQFIRDKGGVIDTHNGHHISVHQDTEHAIGFLRPDLLVVGRARLVRRALDAPGQAQDLTTNDEVMRLVRDASGSTVWVVGHFDAVSRGLKLPGSVSGQVPPVRLVSARATINGGVTATIRAEASDATAAEQLREVVRGFVALARLQGGKQPQFDAALKSIALSGTGKTVQLSFAISPETLRALAPPHHSLPPSPPPSTPQ
ncbi:MAG TPA: hypothetical protein VJM31_10380 [Vicinamibacterales bacterium]|nr:hypothetical protein [Vicinamibacterales bacterium]